MGLATPGAVTMQGLSGGWSLHHAHNGGERKSHKGDERGRGSKRWRRQGSGRYWKLPACFYTHLLLPLELLDLSFL